MSNFTETNGMKPLQAVVLTLQYCLKTFQSTCQCGHCNPCTRGQHDIRQALDTIEKLYAPWGSLSAFGAFFKHREMWSLGEDIQRLGAHRKARQSSLLSSVMRRGAAINSLMASLEHLPREFQFLILTSGLSITELEALAEFQKRD